MTYCLAARLATGLVFCSDSRTSAGMDQVSTYSKMHRLGIDGERQFVVLTAGNLATTQGVVAQLKRDMKKADAPSLRTVPDMSAAADYLGGISLEHQARHKEQEGTFGASFIIGGQILGAKPEIHLVYAEGNHITSSRDTPYLQIGESKYGKPVLDRILGPETSLETAALCALVSMDSTMRSNITVGPPIEMIVYKRDSFVLNDYHRFEEDSEYLRELKRAWDENLKAAFHQLPPLAWAFSWDRRPDERDGASR